MNIVKVNLESPEEEIVHQIVEALWAGQVVAMPFDTSYGLAADAANTEAVERLFLIKGKREGVPISIVVRDYAMLEEVAEVPNEELRKFLLKYFPGKVTVVLNFKLQTSNFKQTSKNKSKISKQLMGKDGTIGIRIPNYRLTNAVAWAFQKAFTSTSANISGSSPCFSAEEIVKQFEGREFQPDLIVDGGELPKSDVSTVVDATVWPPLILRQGEVEIAEAE